MRALIIGNSESDLRDLRMLVTRLGVECNESDVVSWARGAEHAGRLVRDLVLFRITETSERARTLLREVRSVTQGLLVVVGPAEDPKFILRMLHDGADEYVDQEDVVGDLEQILERLRQRNKVDLARGCISALLSCVGGAGTSTLAANLGTELARGKHATALFDLCLRSGDLATLLDLKPPFSLADLCRRGDRLDASLLEQALEQHSTGLRVLSSPKSMDEMVAVSSQGVRNCLSMAKRNYEHVLIDLDRGFGAEQIAAAVRADLVLLTMRLDMLSLRNAARMLTFLDDLGIGRQSVRLVACRVGQRHELRRAVVSEALGMPLWAVIREDAAVANRCQNAGAPVTVTCPRSKLASDIQLVARKLCEEREQVLRARAQQSAARHTVPSPAGNNFPELEEQSTQGQGS